MTKNDSTAPLSKRERFERAGRFPVKKVVISAVVVLAIAGGIIGYVLGTRAPSVGQEVAAIDTGQSAPVSPAGTSTDGGVVDMVELPAPVAVGDTIELSLTDIKNAKLGAFLYSRKTPMPAGFDDLPGQGLPVLAYISPSGKLVVASSLCEPCHSYNFHIEGDVLVCNACFTRWNLDTLEGVSGGCTAYPPDVLQTTVQGDKVIIPTSVLESWTPRI